jgi:TolB-like protein/AraC-like DNA-binding protein
MTFINTKNNLSNNASIAVLPFVNMNNDINNEYFSDGITEEIINALTKVKGLKVIARTSSFAFKNKNIDIRHIGNQLGVATVLEGSIRVFKNNIRINVQLIRTRDGFQVWSQNFDRNLEDIFELQDEVSLLIAEKIRENFGHFIIANHISIIGTKNINAYKLYLKGRTFQLNWALEDYIKAIDFYKKSIEIDKLFYDAYFSLSRSYGILSSWGFIDKEEGLKKAKNYLEKGLKINTTSYLSYFSKSSLYFWIDWNYKKGIEFLKKTLNFNPNYAIAYEGIAEIYLATNQLKNALANINKALEISPLSPNHHFTKGNIYFLKKDYLKAITFLDDCLRIDPNFSLAIETKLACFILLKDEKKFINFISTMPQLIDPEICKKLFYLINNDYYKEKENHTIKINIEESFKSIYPWHFYYLVNSKKIEKSLKIFSEKLRQKNGQLINFRLDPFLEPLRKHRKFSLIVKNIDLLTSISTENINFLNDKDESSNLLTVKEIAKYKLVLNNYISSKKPYLNFNLSLKELGIAINLHPNKLSWLLNAEYHKNFNDFINQYRLAHFKTIALNPKFKHITILGLAYDSGFNSKSVFNTYFKKMEGITPSKWVKMNK